MKLLHSILETFFILHLTTILVVVESANILFYFGVTGQSHVTSFWPVINQLANSGQHNVTLLTSLELKSNNPRVNVVYTKEVNDILNGILGEDSDLLGARMENRQNDLMNFIYPMGIMSCQVILEGLETHDLVYNSKFDLVIYDTCSNECAMGLAYYQYKCPFIGYTPVPFFPYYYDEYGFQPESYSYPEVNTGVKYPLSLYGKIITTLESLSWRFTKQFQYFPELDKMFKEKFILDEGQPSVVDLFSKTSLVFSNSHYSNDNPRSLPPLFVSAAGVGVNTDSKPLPKDLETIASNTKSDGFIYVSFGTIVRMSKSSLELRDKFLRAFGNFPSIHFIWKWEGQDYPTGEDVPKNIHFSSWLPQQDLLAHDRIKGFINQGGIFSIHEATHFGVPMIIFPVLGDQDYNANTLEAKGLALTLEMSNFSQNELENKIHQLLTDKELQKRVHLSSIAFRDRPMKSIDSVIWWIEYVLRTKNTSFLMPTAATKQTWYERRLLDVWLTLFGITITIASILIFILYKLFSTFFLLTTTTTAKEFNQSSINECTSNNGYKSKIH